MATGSCNRILRRGLRQEWPAKLRTRHSDVERLEDLFSPVFLVHGPYAVIL